MALTAFSITSAGASLELAQPVPQLQDKQRSDLTRVLVYALAGNLAA